MIAFKTVMPPANTPAYAKAMEALRAADRKAAQELAQLTPEQKAAEAERQVRSLVAGLGLVKRG